MYIRARLRENRRTSAAERRSSALALTKTKERQQTGAGFLSFFGRIKKRYLLAALLFAVTALALAAAFILLPSLKYAEAEKLLERDEPDRAMQELSQIYNFRDSAALYSQAATEIGDLFLSLDCDIEAAVWYTRAGRSLEAEQIFDFNSMVTGASYVTAAISRNGRSYYLSNREGDDKRAGRNAVASLSAFLPNTPGINGIDRFGLVRFHSLGDYGVVLTEKQQKQLRTVTGVKDMISVQGTDTNPGYTLLLFKNGTIRIFSETEKPLTNTGDWKDIVSVKEGYRKIFGVDRAGKLHIAYEKDYPQELHYDVSGWKNILKVVETGKAIVGLTRDGGIAVAYAGTDARYRSSLSYQKEITDIASNSSLLLLLRANGSVNAIRVPNWASDGDSGADRYLDRAVAAVKQWRGVTRIRFAAKGIYGIRFNGSVNYVSCDVTYDSEKRRYVYSAHSDFAETVSGWTDAVDVISCGTHAIGVFADGTVRGVGDGTYLETRKSLSGATDYLRKTDGEYLNVDSWKRW